MLLLTDRLCIKHYTESDFEDFRVILTNDKIMKSIRGKGYNIKVATEKFQQALEVNNKSSDLGFLNVTLKDSLTLVGFAKLVLMDDGNLEVGYALVEDLWGLGYASEITAALVTYGQNIHPDKEIIGIVNIGNNASKNVLLKQNFIFKKTDTLDGFEVAHYYLSK